MKWVNTFAPIIVDISDKNKFAMNINKNIPVVFNIFLLNKSFKDIKKAKKGFKVEVVIG